MCVAPLLLVCLRRFAYSVLFIAVIANAQSINISKFYYRDYLDFGQNKGAFSGNGSTTITGKDGTEFTIPQTPNFSASSNNGNLTAVGRGFAVTANHVVSPEQSTSTQELRKWGLTLYKIAQMDTADGSSTKNSVSKPYGRDEKFLRFDKYIVEGQTSMLDITNNTNASNPNIEQEKKNLEDFKTTIKSLADSNGNVYIYQAGSGVIDLRNDSPYSKTDLNRLENGETKGGGFAILNVDTAKYYNLINCPDCQDLYGEEYKPDSRGITFTYNANTEGNFNNRITSGDSGSGIYAYDKDNNKWILLGVTSSATTGRNQANIAAVSNKDLLDFQKQFEQEINLKIQDPADANKWALNNTTLKYDARGDTPQQTYNLETNKDIIFSGGGTIEVRGDINRNMSGYAGGFVFEAGDSATSTNPTTYKFINENGKTHSFKGSGLDIGEKVKVEWALKGVSGDSLHKIGKGELVIKTENTTTTGLGTLKIGEGKVTLDTDKKAFDNIYITSGRGELALVSGKAQALGATTNGATSANGTTSYTLSQNKNSEMGFYFGKGGGKFDLAGNSLVLNTIAANDSKAIITNSNGSATLTIEGLGYDSSGNKKTTKENTIIHASIGDNTNGANGTNLNLIYKGDKTAANRHSEGANATEESKSNRLDSSATLSPQNDKARASLIFDGNINTSGKMEVTNGNIALQGHATTHATISDETIREQIKNAENGTQKPMPDYMDLSKPSTLNQPDWDNRTFKFGNGIDLKSSNLTLGRNASLESNITLDNSSKVEFGGSVKHFIDNKDGKNVTGSGFSYQQLVESNALSAEMQKIANETIRYKGTITATGGTIESHILDFNASLDLKSGATLTADYLTIEKSNTIRLENGASASVKTLKLQNLSSDSDLNNIFKNSNTTSGTNPKLKVTEALWFENVSNFDLTKLDSANVQIEQNYDIRGVKSTIKGANKDLSANVSLFEGANLTLQNLTLKNTNANEVTNGTTNAIKNSVYLQGKSTTDNNSQTNTTTTKLTLNENLKAENLNEAKVILWGKSEISAPKIEFSNVKDGILALDKDSKLTSANGNANVEVSGANSSLKIGILGDKSFDINAQGGSKIILSSLPLQDSEAKNPSSKNVDSSPTANFSGKITASGESSVESLLDTITASVILNKSDSNKNDNISGKPSLNAKNITLDSTHNEIYLGANSTLTAQTITAKSLANLTLNADSSATANITKFIFDGGENGTTTNLTGNLIGENIELKNASIVKTSDLTFSKSANLTLDDTSKLEVANLNVNANLTLNFADSAKNTASLQKITLNNNANLNINSWDFGNTTAFSSNGGGRVTFENATYTQNGTPKTISADSTISGVLSLSNVGKAQTTQSTTPNISTDTRFESLKFENKNLSFGEDSKISVSFDSSVKKGESSIKTGDYYKLISAGTITDNRTDKRIDFTNTDFFVVSKFIGNTLYVKFLASAPDSFAELNKNISHEQSRYSEILEALIQANPKDDAIDTATRTDNYSVLDKRIQTIDSDLNEIAQGNKTRQTRNLLFSNDQTINTRISQVRLAQSGRNKHLRFAQNDTMYRIQSLMQGAVRSDAMPSYARERKSDLSNSVWLNVGGGYFGGDSKMRFGATNIGYDRLIYAGSSDILLGAMFGFGGSNAYTGDMTDSAMFYNIGLYLHSIFDSQGGKYGGHEIQSNISFSINDNHKTIESKSAKNTAFGTLFALYYKYNFILAQNDTISHALKPVVVLALGYNRNGSFEIDEYKQATYNSVNFSYGLGVEYNAVMSESFYSLALTLKDMAYSGGERVFMSLSGAQNFIGYSLETAPRFSAEINLIGSHKLTDALYLQYGIAGMLDSGTNYGAKGDIKIGYKF
ncbi:S6 family peptidase [Helicobacter cinaedi]|uniref:S6 family peptidase n=1 Tax=Helicobacter cinaedi TaxID=213 RepID=UPI001FB2433B|nr:S6 family peptidase [Helicobacter cinaedi]